MNFLITKKTGKPLKASSKFIKSFIIVWTIGVLCLSSPFNYAQSENEPNRVILKLFQNLDKWPLGSPLKLAVKVSIERGWHINSDTPNDEFLIPTAFDLLSDRGYKISAIKYPEPLVLNLTFSDAPVSVFEGEFFIGVVMEAPEDLELGEHQIPVELYYQACDDVTCEPPKSAKASLTVTVVDSQAQVKEINKDIFAKLKLDK